MSVLDSFSSAPAALPDSKGRGARTGRGREVEAARSAGTAHPLPCWEMSDRLFSGPLGRLMSHPRFDRYALGLVTRWDIPLYRAWAVAVAAGSSVGQFCLDLNLETAPRRSLARLLARVARHGGRYETTTARWDEAFFGARRRPEGDLVELELDRSRAAQRFMGLRTAFAGLHLRRNLPPIRWELPDPAGARARFARLLEHPESAFPHRSFDGMVEQSASIPTRSGTISWVRFPSPAPGLGPYAWAKVHAPAGVANPPTLIVTHGIGVESDFWRIPYDPLDRLVKRGVCLIRLEPPWHGRRRQAGTAAGEPLLARAPVAMLEFFSAYIAELAVLTAWARDRYGGRVGVGGVSLGALTAQFAAVVARDWPAEARPDGLMLVGTTASMHAVVYRSTLTGALGLPEALAARGWTEAEINLWRPLLEPRGAPVVDPERIVMALGKADDVTPYRQALGLAGRWRVPDENLFLRDQGHFSLIFGLFRDDAPLARMAEILEARAQG